jgi:ribosomal protein S18 acetylase RimI-like enzyme
MSLNLQSMLDCDLAEVATLLNRGFAEYWVRIEFSVAGLLRMVAQDGISVSDSRVALRDDEKVAVALIARRGWSSRLAGMAVVPEARATGVGSWLTAQLLSESRQRGERRMELEVIEENIPGVRLYWKSGFHTLRRLVCFALRDPHEGQKADLEEVDIREVARIVTRHGLPDLPWQVSGESLAQLGPPSRAYKCGAAYAAISDPAASSVAIRSVVVEPQGRRQGHAMRLLRALIAEYPGKEWNVPALCPEEIGGVFERVGFVKGPLAQLHMVTEWS